MEHPNTPGRQESVWDIVRETVTTLVLLFYYWLVAIVKSVIPASIQGKDVSGETVLITGAGSGIGRLMAIRFANLGCRLVLWDMNMAGNEETAAECRKAGATVRCYEINLCNREDIYKVADQVKKDVGQVDILVNNAGIVTGKKFLECPDYLIERTMAVNINAHFWTVKAFLPAMIERNHGHIVSIASSAGLTGVTGLSDYCASKFADVGFDESLRCELHMQGKDGVHTTVVCPYFISTGMFEGAKTRFPLLLPILKPENVVKKIVDAVLCNQEILVLPRILYFFFALKGLNILLNNYDHIGTATNHTSQWEATSTRILPVKCAMYLLDLMGGNNLMDEFRGRAVKSD